MWVRVPPGPPKSYHVEACDKIAICLKENVIIQLLLKAQEKEKLPVLTGFLTFLNQKESVIFVLKEVVLPLELRMEI